MSGKAQIRAALEARLETLAPAIEIAWENMKYSPRNAIPYMQVNLMHARTANPTMCGTGSADMERHTGFLQILLHYPVNKGPGLADAKADAVVALYARGLSLTSSGVTVDILDTPTVAPSLIKDGTWYVVPVTVYFRADIFQP